MTEATQTANPTDAREASKSRVTTQDSFLSKLTPPEAAKEPPEVKPEVKATAKTEDEPKKEEGRQEPEKTTPLPKKSAQERIQELASKRNEAEAKAEAEKRRADDLEAQVQALRAQAKPLEAQAKPLRSQFTTDDEYIDALTTWKTNEAIAKREAEQAQARAEAEAAEVAAVWSRRQDAVMKTLPDYAEVLGKSEVNVADHIHAAILESEQGPQIAYYLALHPEEAKRLNAMKQVAGIKRVRDLERDLAEIDREEEPPPKEEKPAVKAAEEKPPVQQSKAPKPIDHVKSVPSASGSSTNDYEEYRRRRKAEQRAKA